LAAGAVGLVVLFFCINFVATRVPLRAVFLVTSAFLFVMAIKFIGDAITEFQEQLLVPSDPVMSMAWLLDIGFNPTLEALAAQGAVIVLAVISFALWHRSASRTSTAASAS
jgi:high-affinity iron transporter